MNKIIKVALEAKFPGLDLTNLMEVIIATGNEIVATETILGIYESPEIPETSIRYNDLCTFISFNKYKEEVKYSRPTSRKKSLYFENQEAADNCLEYDESIGKEYYYRGDWKIEKSFSVPYVEESTCSLSEWVKKSK